jgi:hypothetical protein
MDLRCPYCGSGLTVSLREEGYGHMRRDVPDCIECDAPIADRCAAEWEPDGTLRRRPDWQEYPDLYSKPDDVRRDVDADELANDIHTGMCGCQDNGDLWLHRTMANDVLARYHVTRREADDTWDRTVPPGGNVCAVCGTPTETEPCREHQPQAWARCRGEGS